MLTLNTVVTTVVNVESWLLDEMVLVSVVVAVVADKETLREVVEFAVVEAAAVDEFVLD